MSEPVEFASAEAMRDWLAAHHDKAGELWVRLWKVATGRPSITWEEGVREALCWGWIDAVKRSEGDESWLQRFTPRRKGSNWSERNRRHVDELIAAGRMRAPGLAEVQAARADGRWDAAYAGPAGMEIPADFLSALDAAPERARATYETLNRRNLYAIYYRVTSAKWPETRAKRIAALIEVLARGERFH